MLKRIKVVALIVAASVSSVLAADTFTETFDIKPGDFRSTGRNDYFILEPNYQLIMEGQADGKPSRLVITVLDKIKKIDNVETRVVEEYETVDGKVVEVSRNYFAVDQRSSDIYYFGEDVDEYKDGKVSAHPGSWRSGKSGAKYGLFMPAKPVVGQKFAQEIAPKIAMDRVEVVSTTNR